MKIWSNFAIKLQNAQFFIKNLNFLKIFGALGAKCLEFYVLKPRFFGVRLLLCQGPP